MERGSAIGDSAGRSQIGGEAAQRAKEEKSSRRLGKNQASSPTNASTLEAAVHSINIARL